MRATFDATDDVVVVTGGANGISRAVAEGALRAGAAVAVVDVVDRPADLPDSIHYHQTDVSDRHALETTATRITAELGAVTGLVCGAVIQPRARVLDLEPDEWRRVQQVNLDGVLWTCQAFVPGMVAGGGGAVVVFTSGIATSGWPEAVSYSTTKAAALGLARTLAAEVAAANVKVNLISPGVVDTPQYRNANDKTDRRHWAETVGVGVPADVVAPILFLLSDAATMTGSLLARERGIRGRSMSLPIVVVGAGPVGLTTALGLVHYGLDVIVLEEDAELSRDTKAGTILTRTIEVFERYGVVQEVLARALRIDEIGDVDRATGETQRSIKTWLLRDDTRHPYVINIPQHFLEPVLADALASRAPGSLRLGHRLVAFEQQTDRITLTAETIDGPVKFEASYLLACDGGRSTVRKALNIGVSGTTFPERYMLVDVAVDLDVANPRDYPYLAYFADPEEWMILVRQPEFWRFLYPRKPAAPELDQAALADKVRQYIGDVEHLEVVGSYDYTVHARAADDWRRDRIFLMGDAAHLITPMWALGLNTGVLDASNLPWRLAWVERGWAEPGLLDGYEQEQAPLARHGSAAMAEAASQYMSRRSQSLEAMTDHDWANAMTRAMLAVRLDVAGTGEWALTVDGDEPVRLRVGDRIPDIELRAAHGAVTTHQLVEDRFVALYFTDVRRRPGIPPSTPALAHFAVSRWDAPLDGGLRDRSLLDVGSVVERRLGCPPDTVVLLRPDGHVAAMQPMTKGVGEAMYRTVTGRPSDKEKQ